MTLTPEQRLVIYTSNVYGYQIGYPPGWVIDESVPKGVSISSKKIRGFILIQVFSIREFTGGRTVSSLDELTSLAMANTRSFDGFERFDDTIITLENGAPAHIVDLKFDDPNTEAGLVWSKYLVTKLGGTVYEAQFYWPYTAYSRDVNQLATRIITSFTPST